jgi:L-threonylcarbamoyladenylate synthase
LYKKSRQVSIIGTNLTQAVRILEAGGLVAIPTETVYGLSANALNPEAVLTVFEVKKRPSFDPLIVHLPSMDAVSRYVTDFPESAQKLARAFWPGPLTLLLPKKDVIPDLVTSGLSTVAIRVPDHPLTLALLKSLDFPLAAPSANPFGYISPTTAGHVENQLGNQVPYILDGGECQVGIESTIIGFPDGQATVVRLGGLRLEDIEGIIGKVEAVLESSSNPTAPGMLKSHYAPRKALYLMSRKELIKKQANSHVGRLFFNLPDNLTPGPADRVLSASGNFREAAQHLFAYLREMDADAIDEIWAEYLPEQDLGRAINDRLRRASVQYS